MLVLSPKQYKKWLERQDPEYQLSKLFSDYIDKLAMEELIEYAKNIKQDVSKSEQIKGNC